MNMEYSYLAVKSGSAFNHTASGVTTNICDAGLAFVADRPLQEGQDLKLFVKQLSQDPLDARVIWCGTLSATAFKIGIAFR